jgi:hypothetical protein
MAVPVILIAGAAILSGSIALVELHGPAGQIIYVNPREVSSIREPLQTGHFARGVQCLVYLSNRNFITVIEPCETVRLKLSAYP